MRLIGKYISRAIGKQIPIGSVINVLINPIITVPTAENIMDVSATVGASLDIKGLPTIWSIEYGLTNAYGSSKPGGTVILNGAVSAGLTGLTVHSTIYWRIKCINSEGTFYGEGQLFSTYYTETITYISGLTTPLSDDQKSNIDQFINEIKSGLNISLLSDYFDVITLLNNETSEVSLRNLARRSNDYQAISSPTFSIFEGWKGNGTNAYFKTNFNPSTDGVRFVQNSAHINVVSNTDYAQTISDYGGLISSGIMFAIRFAAPYLNQSYSRLNQGANTTWCDVALVTNSIGFFSLSSENTTIKWYKDGGLLATATRTTTAVVNLEMYALSRNSTNGTPSGFSQNQLALITVGKTLTLSEIGILKTAYENYKARIALFFLGNIIFDETGQNLLTENNDPIYA